MTQVFDDFLSDIRRFLETEPGDPSIMGLAHRQTLMRLLAGEPEKAAMIAETALLHSAGSSAVPDLKSLLDLSRQWSRARGLAQVHQWGEAGLILALNLKGPACPDGVDQSMLRDYDAWLKQALLAQNLPIAEQLLNLSRNLVTDAQWKAWFESVSSLRKELEKVSQASSKFLPAPTRLELDPGDAKHIREQLEQIVQENRYTRQVFAGPLKTIEGRTKNLAWQQVLILAAVILLPMLILCLLAWVQLRPAPLALADATTIQPVQTVTATLGYLATLDAMDKDKIGLETQVGLLEKDVEQHKTQLPLDVAATVRSIPPVVITATPEPPTATPEQAPSAPEQSTSVPTIVPIKATFNYKDDQRDSFSVMSKPEDDAPPISGLTLKKGDEVLIRCTADEEKYWFEIETKLPNQPVGYLRTRMVTLRMDDQGRVLPCSEFAPESPTIEPATPSIDPTAVATPWAGTVKGQNGDKVNIRREPNFIQGVLAVLDDRTPVQVLCKVETPNVPQQMLWFRIVWNLNGIDFGYIAAQLTDGIPEDQVPVCQ